MATYALTSPANVIRDTFRNVAEIEQVYLATDGEDGIFAMIVVDAKDYPTLRRIIDLETSIINTLPGTPIEFDIVIREGRPLGDIVSPRGRLLFQR